MNNPRIGKLKNTTIINKALFWSGIIIYFLADVLLQCWSLLPKTVFWAFGIFALIFGIKELTNLHQMYILIVVSGIFTLIISCLKSIKWLKILIINATDITFSASSFSPKNYNPFETMVNDGEDQQKERLSLSQEMSPPFKSDINLFNKKSAQ